MPMNQSSRSAIGLNLRQHWGDTQSFRNVLVPLSVPTCRSSCPDAALLRSLHMGWALCCLRGIARGFRAAGMRRPVDA